MRELLLGLATGRIMPLLGRVMFALGEVGGEAAMLPAMAIWPGAADWLRARAPRVDCRDVIFAGMDYNCLCDC